MDTEEKMIKVCTCEHLAQDELHGKNNRVMNFCKKGSFLLLYCLWQRISIKSR